MTPADYTALGCAIRDARRAACLSHHQVAEQVTGRNLRDLYALRALLDGAEQGLGYTAVAALELARHVDAIATALRIAPTERVRWYVLAGVLESEQYKAPSTPAPVPTRVLVHNSTMDALSELAVVAQRAWPGARIVMTFVTDPHDPLELLTVRAVAQGLRNESASPVFKGESFARCTAGALQHFANVDVGGRGVVRAVRTGA